MKKRRIYISGPISGLNREQCISKFKQTQLMLEDLGYEVFNPKENGLPEDASTAEHMRRDLNELTREDKPYDAIYMMRRWTHSAGCRTEFDAATAIHLDVIFEDGDGCCITFE